MAQKMSYEDEEQYYPVLTNVRSCDTYYTTGCHVHVTVYT